LSSMAKQKPFDWVGFRLIAENVQKYGGDSPEASTSNVLALLDSREALAKTIDDAIKELPKRSTNKVLQRVSDILRDGRRNGER